MTRLPVYPTKQSLTFSGMNATKDSTKELITAEMVWAGLTAYRDFLGDDRPLISDEIDLIVEIYRAMEKAKLK
jgi:hypothetical protein